jgi:hypothetical protein
MPLTGLLAVSAGCREELGPVTFPRTRVTGEVREGGQPVAGGWIEFVPVEGTVGNLRSAPLSREGRFTVSGVAVGKNLIGLVNAPVRMPGGRQRFHSQASPIRRVIPRGPSSTMVIDLLDEAIRYQAAAIKQVPEMSP